MIIVLDDSLHDQKKYNDVSFLDDIKYKNLIKIYDKPTLKDFREIVQSLPNCLLFCNHRSLRLINKEGDFIDSKNTIKNLYANVTENNITRVEFGRDMHTNIEAKTLEKNKFYSNLKSFLDAYIATQSIELKVLYSGENFAEIEKLSFLDNILDEISTTEIANFHQNEIIINGIEKLFDNLNPKIIIKEWQNKELTKKEIRILLNRQI